jgi:hypothetical protein
MRGVVTLRVELDVAEEPLMGELAELACLAGAAAAGLDLPVIRVGATWIREHVIEGDGSPWGAPVAEGRP